MDTQRNEQLLHAPRRKGAMYRTKLVVACAIIFWLLGSLSLAFADQRPASFSSTPHGFRVQATSAGRQRAIALTTPTATLAATPTPKPTPAPTAPPIVPFPAYASQQKALLQANDRFFYHGNENLPEIALTFDDGPNPPYTGQILNILSHYGVKATFFCVGRQVQAYPAIVKQAHDEGHLIENHTWAHAFLPMLSETSAAWQLSTTQDAIERVTGVRPAYFRPPYGAFGGTTLMSANKFGFSTFLWNVDPRDWSRPGADAIVARIRAQTKNGSIILMHDGGGDRSQTVAALPAIIEGFLQRGFHFVTLREMVAHLHVTPTGSPPPIAKPNATPNPLETWKAIWKRKVSLWRNSYE